MEANQLRHRISDLEARLLALRGYLDYDRRRDRLSEIERELGDPTVWNRPERAQELGRERARLAEVVESLDRLARELADARELLELAAAERDEAALAGLGAEVEAIAAQVARLEFRRMFSGEMDAANAFVDIQAGAGGTEAQDWAEMLLRMYLRWCEGRGFRTELLELTPGEVAGIKSASFRVEGDHAYGWLKTETGVHRLVRKSPFDADHRRHTSFASVFVSPEVEEDIAIEINPAELRMDVYRSSGAGGQHVNKTESAVRLTHLPTGIVVACQSERSQHANRERALKMLKAKLYELELAKREAEKRRLEESKADIGWGSQIRNYVLDQSRIKDLRTGLERSDTQRVLDGDLDPFIEAALKMGLEAGARRPDAA
ncbi:MAG: peptide chain release factor 2 [Xanthomonadales bacterium]|nr:peptide chain release factor 2 [Xanthomonadales bacterium]